MSFMVYYFFFFPFYIMQACETNLYLFMIFFFSIKFLADHCCLLLTIGKHTWYSTTWEEKCYFSHKKTVCYTMSFCLFCRIIYFSISCSWNLRSGNWCWFRTAHTLTDSVCCIRTIIAQKSPFIVAISLENTIFPFVSSDECTQKKNHHYLHNTRIHIKFGDFIMLTKKKIYHSLSQDVYCSVMKTHSKVSHHMFWGWFFSPLSFS